MPRLDKLGVDVRTLEVLAHLPVPITLAESLLSRDVEQLASECGVSTKAASKLRYLVALRCQPQPLVPERKRRGREPHGGGHDGEDGAAPSSPLLSFATAEALYDQAREVGGFVTTGSASLDSLLCKGLMLHHVVEVAGRSSVGKTQLCLTAAVAAASHGIGVLYLDTANGCNVKRMQQIARSRYSDANGEMSARQMDAMLDRLRVVHASDISGVISTLVEYMDGVIASGGTGGVYADCRLVILDSVTAVVSPILGGAKNPAGHGLMATLGHLLNEAASRCSACVLVANNTVAPRGGVSGEEEPRVALGMTWESVPSIRVLLGTSRTWRTSEGKGDEQNDKGIPSGRPEARVATLLKHPAQACGSTTSFAIGDGGVSDA